MFSILLNLSFTFNNLKFVDNTFLNGPLMQLSLQNSETLGFIVLINDLTILNTSFSNADLVFISSSIDFSILQVNNMTINEIRI